MSIFKEYITKYADRIDLIASDFYSNSYDYGEIININRDKLIPITEIEGQIDPIKPVPGQLAYGIRLLIPVREVVEGQYAEELPPWEK